MLCKTCLLAEMTLSFTRERDYSAVGFATVCPQTAYIVFEVSDPI